MLKQIVRATIEGIRKIGIRCDVKGERKRQERV